MCPVIIREQVNPRTLFERANRVLPAGVSYGIRALPPYPFYIDHAKGVKLYDVDGNVYTDFWVGHGALILGHAPDPVITGCPETVAIRDTFWVQPRA